MNRPHRIPTFTFEQSDQIYFLVNTETGEETECNVIVYLIWQLCDGNTTVDEMVSLLKEAYPDTSEDIAEDIDVILNNLSQLGALSS